MDNKQMNWIKLLSTQRFFVDDEKSVVSGRYFKNPEDIGFGSRSEFHVDHDRIVFSSAFRRLGRKTQVHTLAVNDHTHNRLTHSVEVASVGRSLGNMVGATLSKKKLVPENINSFDFGTLVQVACLAHDIGNPPFGHAGEDALRAWFLQEDKQCWLNQLNENELTDIKNYEGNAHSLRMLASLEMYAEKGGMQLTAAVIGSLIKYPWTSALALENKNKFNIYQTELAYFQAVAKELGLIRKDENKWARHPLSYLMEAADDICYALIDLEDAVEIGILDFAEIQDLLGEIAKPKKNWDSGLSTKQKCSTLRGLSIGCCVEEVAKKFIENHDLLMAGDFSEKEILSVCASNIKESLIEAKEFANKKIYHHRSKLLTELASFPCLGSLLDAFIPAVYRILTDKKNRLTRDELLFNLLDSDGVTQINKDDSLYIGYMKVLDYVGSLTDNAAAKLAHELSGVGIL